ncbi:MAG: DNA gyrase inhibitor YacG [Alphaproteobacteria bacterium]|nr:DNA gyrase inhibitor YacG [Alphaproteobacteria bacterium]
MTKRGTQTCPICGKPVVDQFKPFCSSRCSMVDFGAWIGETYRLKSEETDEETTTFPEKDPENNTYKG